MAKPIKHGNKWRIRWTDAHGRRESEVYDSYADADFKLNQRKTEAEEVRRGLRRLVPKSHDFDELCEYWLKKMAAHKRSGKDDFYIIRASLRPAFGKLQVRNMLDG